MHNHKNLLVFPIVLYHNINSIKHFYEIIGPNTYSMAMSVVLCYFHNIMPMLLKKNDVSYDVENSLHD